jgi:hypothetical protein
MRILSSVVSKRMRFVARMRRFCSRLIEQSSSAYVVLAPYQHAHQLVFFADLAQQRRDLAA